jgi:hypothetical protein
MKYVFPPGDFYQRSGANDVILKQVPLPASSVFPWLHLLLTDIPLLGFWHVYVLPPGYFVWPCSPHIHRTEFVTLHNEQKESFQQYFYNRYKIVVYIGLRSDSIKNHASRNEARRIAAMRIIFTCIGCTLLTCNMYMSDLRHIHDPVLSSLKMEGILFFIAWPLLPTQV